MDTQQVPERDLEQTAGLDEGRKLVALPAETAATLRVRQHRAPPGADQGEQRGPGVGRQVVVRQLDQGPVTAMSRMLDRSAGHPEVKKILIQHVETVIVEPIVAQLDGPDARARALLATTIIMGGGPVRRLLGLTDLRAADPAELTDRLTAMFTAALAPSQRA